MVFDEITDFVRRLLGVKKKVLVGKVMKDEEISKLDKEIEYERGYKEGQISALEEDVKELKKSLTPKDLNLAEYLSKQRKSLYYKQFQNSLSLKRMYGFTLKKGIKVTSYNSKKNFGEFDDILIRPDGRFALVVRNGKRKEPIMVGKDVKHIFTNYGGLLNMVNSGIMQINLDENGKYAENILEKEIPEVIIDSTGAYHITEINREGYMKQLIEKEEQIQELYGLLSAYEKEIQKVTGNKRLLKVISQFNESRAITAETEMAKAFNSVSEVNKNFSEVAKELAIKGYSQHINEQKIDSLEGMKDAVISKMNEYLGKADVDIAREDWIKMANDIIDITQGAKINIIQQSPPHKEETGALTDKFKRIKVAEPS